MAVGVGVVIAKAERERRASRRRSTDHRLGLLADELLAGGLKRTAVGQLDLAIEMLERGNGSVDGGRAVHETRKALKRLRTLLRLVRAQLGETAFAREDGVLSSVGRALSGARDADVMLATLDQLIARHPRKLTGRSGVSRLRARLVADQQRMARAALGEESTRAQALADLHACRERMGAWSLPERGGFELVEPGLLRSYQQGRQRLRRAARSKGEDLRRMHAWRKRVKDLRYAVEMLQRRDSSDSTGAHEPRGKRARRRRAQAHKDAARLRRLARSAEQLGEMLGEDHDLAVLAGLIRSAGKRGGGDTARIGRGTRKTLLKLISRRRRELRRRALREGERLYRRTPKKFVRRIGAALERR